ncbi:MAG: hypothetical protein JJE51_12755 [Thermoanaerobaculia bacterium]|nr:hypothetical protein [Thermoanaerobaculia bacterium]
MKKLTVIVALLALAAFPVLAGEWHTGQTNLCADCHTMHNSMAHTWTGPGTVTVGTPSADGNWVKAAGPAGNFLLKADDPNALCLACHDSKPFAPDVLGTNSAGGSTNRSAGYLNDGGLAAHTGHTLGWVGTAPGGAFVTPAEGLECINCHTQHGRAGVYRNLGPRSGATVPTYALAGAQARDMTGLPTDLAGATAHATVDVFINAPGYIANTSNFAALYETANISYLKRAALVNGIENASGTQCAYCHGDFHGAINSTNIGGEVAGASFDKFNRHPVGGIVLGSLGGGHSALPSARYANAVSVSRVKVYADDQATFADATPGCISCHKAHGNGQPFGLVFANRTLPGMTEDGNVAVPTTGAGTAVAQRALCGQCHGQGN